MEPPPPLRLDTLLSRRRLLGLVAVGSWLLGADPAESDRGASDLERLVAWVGALRREGSPSSGEAVGEAAVRVGELAEGTPYRAGALDEYLAAGDPAKEPLVLSLTRFDCETLVESCLAVARVAALDGEPTWDRFGQQIEQMRYRAGSRSGYASRLHYFSEWIREGQRRGLVRELGPELGGEADTRPLRFMTEHRSSYPALVDDGIYARIGEVERALDDHPRWVVPTRALEGVADRIQSGDVLAFATSIPGLDVTHTALAHRGADGSLRILHAPHSGGVVEISRSTLPAYVQALRGATGILIARPL